MKIPSFLGSSTPPDPPVGPVPAGAGSLPRRVDRPFLRTMTATDAALAWEIERASFEPPWSVATLVDMLKRARVFGIAASLGGRFAGYAIYESHRTFIQVHRLAVEFDMRKNGVGRQLLERVERNCRPGRQDRVEVIVSEWMTPAHLWLKHMGYAATEIIHGQPNPDDSAYLFCRNLPSHGPE